MEPEERRVKIHQEEMESLLNLKSLLDHKETVSSYVEEYQKLGWVLEVVTPLNGTDLEVDSGELPETWVNRLWETGVAEPKINLGVRTGKRSRLMILEVAKGAGESILDRYGPWRAECTAALGAGREHHFYAWEPSSPFDSGSFRTPPGIKWFGEGQVVLVPPACDPEMRETWRWLCPPWEKPPQYPSQSLARFLRQHLTRAPQPEVSSSWQELHALAPPDEPMLQASSVLYPSMRNYYQGILEAASALGLKAPEVLLSMLWHATGGNACLHPEIWGSLEKLVAEAQDQTGTVTFPGNVPGELFLDNALPQSGKSSAGSSGQAPDKTGPPCFPQRRMTKPPPPGAAIRTPFSCRKIRGDFRKI